MKEIRIDRAKIDGFGARMKHRARQAWNWTKDHAVPLAIGTAAAVGGGYLLYKHHQNGEPEGSPVAEDHVPEDLSWTGDIVNERWDAMESRAAETIGPSDDDPEY